MMWDTHMVGGAAAWLGFTATAPVVAGWLGFSVVVPPIVTIVGTPVSAIAALGNDIDSRNAKATKSLRWVTYGLHLWLKRHMGGHREGMHSILRGIPLVGLVAALAVLGVMALAAWRSESYTDVSWLLMASSGVAGAVGAWSHSALDSLTNGGVAWLWPYRTRRYGFSLMKVNGSGEIAVRLVLWVLAGVAGWFTVIGW